MGVAVGVGVAVGAGVGVGVGVAAGAVLSTPVAAYRYLTPYRLLTLRPLTALIRYQLEPDFAVGQVARQLDPLTLATTVTLALVASFALIVVPVEVPVRMFTPEQAGTIVVEAGTMASTGAEGAVVVLNRLTAAYRYVTP